MNTYLPPGSGKATKRGSTWLGMWMTESEVWGSVDRLEDRIDATRHMERLPRYGKG